LVSQKDGGCANKGKENCKLLSVHELL
jgi:hypothetical protein